MIAALTFFLVLSFFLSSLFLEIKKPPVAPKPKFVIGHKAVVPPPVAPKPDVVLADVLQPTKKIKPAIAPKPKVLKDSSVPDVTTVPLSRRKYSKSLDEHKSDSSEYVVHLNYKNGIQRDNTAYIISVCSCSFECIHKFGNGESTCKTPSMFEQLDNLEDIGIDEQPASSVKPSTILDKHNEKNINKSRVVVNASFLEEKLKNVLTQNIFPSNSHLRQKSLDKLEKDNISSSNNDDKIECTGLAQSSSSFEDVVDNLNNPTKIIGEISETSTALTEKINNSVCSYDKTTLVKVKNDNLCPSSYTKNEEFFSSLGTASTLPTKSLPVPKPRKLRNPCLVRQNGVDIPSEGTNELIVSECDSAGLSSYGFRKTAKINVLVQNVSYNNQESIPIADKSEITSYVAAKMHHSKESDHTKDLISQNPLSQVLHESSLLVENVESSLIPNPIHSADNTMEDDVSMLAANKKSGFIRCNNLSMSLPKQLKLSCNQLLPALDRFMDSAQKEEDKDARLKSESSQKIVPKKPQRHSLPAAGLLKKAASEEFVDKTAYISNEEKQLETPVEGPHLSAEEQSALLSCNIPKSSLEKPVWKLPHPILPFSGNPDALKNTKNSKNSVFASAVTKPRAKSLSSVDMERIHKPPKEHQKKTSLKKFLNMKLSVCIMKSDLQRFLTKGSQCTDNASATFSSREGLGKNLNADCTTNGRKTKPSKAHSAEIISSSPSPKEKQIQRGQSETLESRRSPSLDEQTFTLQGQVCTPDYENVRHYEEIPEYENLPFASVDKNPHFEWQNSNSVEDHDNNIYEVEELYEAARGCSRLGRYDNGD